MSNTFGEGYSSRSDEEGFGGTNQTLPGSRKQDNAPNSNGTLLISSINFLISISKYSSKTN